MKEARSAHQQIAKRRHIYIDMNINMCPSVSLQQPFISFLLFIKLFSEFENCVLVRLVFVSVCWVTLSICNALLYSLYRHRL